MNFLNKIFRKSKVEPTTTLAVSKGRHPLNAEGDFYVEKDSCTLCGAPEVMAKGLMAHSNEGCYFIKQPISDEEIELAVSSIAVSCVRAVRYGGNDQKIIKRLYDLGCESECDFLLIK